MYGILYMEAMKKEKIFYERGERILNGVGTFICGG